MNKAKLTALCHKISKNTGLTFNSVMTYYFLEAILKKLSQSSYSNHYIFKGGFLLSNVIGVESRSTADIDFLFHKQTLSEENIQQQLEEILTESKDGIQFSIQSITAIKESDDYGGYRATILCQLENIKQIIHLDIATGDIVTPYPATYDYKAIFDDDNFPIIAYTIETILAEKLQTIYSRNFLNSRSKDFYDVYILSKLKKDDIDFSQLKIACERTFSYRETELDFNKIIELLERFKSDSIQQQQWQNYSKKYSYTKDILFTDILNEIISLLIALNSNHNA
ncbi:nucleotidyl transferase AbiEii/AbiGii toxin family protein [Streptococcus anginosus]|uniref:Nucleotidyl transferase AbiEii/AbiGii toxin family protein n=1 Tax=Streptococcus anginosus TaxID=1328 RepID=A0AAW5TFI2_STRAP|nr:nucleotidyl transferase AbiEii/AbiGii toxin family protein [Streptococcus anginosus]HEO3777627.1 nucleotidyl transferase AbiEii/AbiGii toxin family protein [Streptococcus agalactiae]MCW0946984.1 nucleotidyl transferase AbiEii/AbiGii toxin family protein [Streptococcus anginosus]MCW0971846.1 nucleotidyl transferase AbiEii/AbiGii toxin family protein [Streptococcus anginosus]MCW0989519.1 nucleotidyl transferase AbiEii/AbiGii toxin family protein [Streptococcus anginosus]MCW0992905.1 nucleotid